jgi:hypothetical protein
MNNYVRNYVPDGLKAQKHIAQGNALWLMWMGAFAL